MTNFNSSLEEIIRQHIYLTSSPNSSGWHSVLCKVCNDHGRKGLRAGFKFEGNVVSYRCFNCGHASNYDPSRDKRLSDNMVEVMRSFGIPEDVWRIVIFANLSEEDKKQQEEFKTKIKNYEPIELSLPSHFYRLDKAPQSDKSATLAYLRLEERGFDPNGYTMYLSTGQGKEKDAFKWKNRLILPTYKDEKLIYYQGRDLLENNKREKYLGAAVPRDKVIHGINRVLDRTATGPIYIVEGWFDAEIINGIAVFGNKLSEAIIWQLNRTSREKVVIPDKKGNGFFLANQAIKLGWSVSFPDTGDCKDISQAVQRFGKLYTMKSIREQTKTGIVAAAALPLYCEDNNEYKKARRGKRPRTN